jgi:glycerol-3-phosphate acyltransferase PlsY
MLLPLLLVAGAYTLGSIPFSFLIGRLFGAGDIRTTGSGNVGATNVLRAAGKVPAVLALLLDVSKGSGAILLARALLRRPQWPFPSQALLGTSNQLVSLPTFWIGLAGLTAVLGHIFPLWLGFRGGKGVATATGVFLTIDPTATAGAAIIFLIVVAATRYVSLASIAGAAAEPLLLRFMVHQTFWIVVFATIISILVIAKHHQNIARLASGSEHRIGQSRERR